MLVKRLTMSVPLTLLLHIDYTLGMFVMLFFSLKNKCILIPAKSLEPTKQYLHPVHCW